MSDVSATPDEGEAFLTPNNLDSTLTQTIFEDKRLLLKQVADQTQFIHLLLHQLATPLTSLQGSVHLLSEDLSEDQRQEFLALVHQQVQHLQDLLQSLVALQNLEAGMLDARLIAFCLRSLAEEVRGKFYSRLVVNHIQSLPHVWGDRWQVSQILINLLSNATKYSSADSAIEIGATLNSEGFVEVWVQDHGLGIPADGQAHLFERFYRVRHPDRANISGTGLGLSLCKLLVENQGGQIGFESVHGEGSRFYFTLLMAQPA